ncbi:hypothetical protein V6N13_009275 [Hibiscus sabdariffa]
MPRKTSDESIVKILRPLKQKLDAIEARQLLFMRYIRDRDVAISQILLKNFSDGSTTLPTILADIFSSPSDTAAATAAQNQGKEPFVECTRTESLHCFSSSENSNSAAKKSPPAKHSSPPLKRKASSTEEVTKEPRVKIERTIDLNIPLASRHQPPQISKRARKTARRKLVIRGDDLSD